MFVNTVLSVKLVVLRRFTTSIQMIDASCGYPFSGCHSLSNSFLHVTNSIYDSESWWYKYLIYLIRTFRFMDVHRVNICVERGCPSENEKNKNRIHRLKKKKKKKYSSLHSLPFQQWSDRRFPPVSVYFIFFLDLNMTTAAIPMTWHIDKEVNSAWAVMSRGWHLATEATDWMQRSRGDRRTGSKERSGDSVMEWQWVQKWVYIFWGGFSPLYPIYMCVQWYSIDISYKPELKNTFMKNVMLLWHLCICYLFLKKILAL